MRTDESHDPTLQNRLFGRSGKPHAAAIAPPFSTVADDIRLFALTFAGGFLFMTVFLA
jgi:hypothetical protein